MTDTTQENTDARPLGFLMDVRLQVSVELGRRRFRIAELLSLSQGSILELDKVAGEPLDIRVNDHLIARGEAVVVNDKFGVRLTEIMTPSEMGKLL
jgi:flagellar motor switch protein FliN/FliY